MPGLFDTILGTDDPSTADPATGLLDSQRRQLAFSTLGNIGATLLAAGQDIMPGQRANILAQLGQVPGNTMQMQSQLMQQNAYAQRAAREKKQDVLDTELSQVASTPEFLSAIKEMPADMQRIIPALVKSGRARDAITMVDNWRTNQAREAAVTARDNRVPFGWERKQDGSIGFIPDGPADPNYLLKAAEAKKMADAKAIPQTVTTGIQNNLGSMKTIDQALAALDATPDAVGSVGSYLQSMAPKYGGDLNNKVLDPKGLDVRALISNIGSLKIHDRSGAAVTASETPRLIPFIPQITDDAPTVRKKLTLFKQEYERAVKDATEYYSPDNGFKAYTPATTYLQGGGQSAAPAPSPTQGGGQQGGGDAPPASALKDGHITNFANGQSWTLQGGKPVRVK
jgi:hypothetical protein